MDATIQALDESRHNDYIAFGRVAPRPGYGESGTTLAVQCNAFVVKGRNGSNVQNIRLHQYSLILRHPRNIPMPRDVNYKCFEKLVNTNILPATAVYDGAQLMYLPHQLEVPEASGEVSVDSAVFPVHEETWTFEYRETVSFHLTDILALFRNVVEEVPAALSVLQAIGIALRHGVASRHPTIKNKYFPRRITNKPIVTEKGVEIRSGYIGTIQAVGRSFEEGASPSVLFNVDSACGAFYQEPKCSEMSSVMELCLRRLQVEPSSATLNRLTRIPDDLLRPLNNFLKNLSIDIKIDGQEPKTRKAKSLSSGSAANIVFQNQAGQTVSVAEHFLATYNIRLRHPNLPCLLFGARNMAFPIEFCYVRSNQVYRLKLDPQMQQKALEQQKFKPKDRFTWIRRARDEEREDFAKLQSLGLEVSKSLLEVKARLIKSPAVLYHRDEPARLDELPASWNAKGRRYFEPQRLESWVVLDLAGSQHGQIEGFAGFLAQKLKSSGVVLARAPPPIIRQSPFPSPNLRSDMKVWIKDSVNSADKVFGRPPQLILVITKDKTDNPLYHAIKVSGDSLAAKTPFTTQVMCQKHLRTPGGNDQYMTNLALKVNLKLGGMNHRVKEVTAAVEHEATMVVGADVAHGTGAGKPSIAAMVASLDKDLMRYTCTAAVQPLIEPTEGMDPARAVVQEPIKECRPMLTTLLQRWAKHSPEYPVPKHVIYYRDGVSDSELVKLARTEIPAIQGALEEAVQGYYPGSNNRVKLTYVVCNKSTTYRFMPLQDERKNHKGNCPAGTIVDRDIASPFYFDFYAITHGTIQGTSRPVRYILLHDEAKMSADRIQELTSYLCYGYQRATRAVGLVTPVYYADLVAARARLWILGDDETGSLDGFGNDSTPELRADSLATCTATVERYLAGMEALVPRMWWL